MADRGGDSGAKGSRRAVSIAAVLRARCPSCRQGGVLSDLFWIRKTCPVCGYDFHPEPGFYLGAMMMGFLVTGILTVPPVVVLKLMNVDLETLLVFPFVEFIFVGSFLLVYMRIIWLHCEYAMTDRLDGHPKEKDRTQL